MLQATKRGSMGACALASVLLVAACVSASPSQSGTRPSPQSGEAISTSGPKRLVAAIQADPKAFNDRVARFSSSGPPRGGPELGWLLNSGLTVTDDRGVLQSQLAEAAPSLENGLWKVFPDGRMQTTWTIRPGAQWHDGTPFTSQDLLFTAQVVRDSDLAAAFRESAYDLIESVEASDPRTLVVRWEGPTIDADRMFSQVLAVPMPRHLLEKTYAEDKERFIQLPYWLAEFVGTGPFSLRSWVQGSHVLLQANDRYVLGRPKIDELEVQFITDPNTVVSNILAGAVELTLGYGLSLDSALELRRQWAAGKVEMAPNGWLALHPQFLNPRPAVIADHRFRQALMHGLNRQEMVDTLQSGMVVVAHAFLNSAEPEYPAVESSFARYEYDPARALQEIEALGYSRGADGMFADAAGQRLAMEIWVTDGLEIQVKATYAVTDYLRRIGVTGQPVVRSPQLNAVEKAEVANFPGFRLMRNPNTIDDMKAFLISRAPVPENRFTGQNFARYMNQDFNDLIERYFRTIPKQERIELLRQIVHHQSQELSQMGLFYNVQSVAIGKRVRNVTNGGAQNFNQAWNAHAWDLG